MAPEGKTADSGAHERPLGHQSGPMATAHTQETHGVGRQRPGPFGSDQGPARHLPEPTIGLDAPFPAATAQGAAPGIFLRRCYEPFGGCWELGLLLAATMEL